MPSNSTQLHFFAQLCRDYPDIYDPTNRWSMPSTQVGWDEIIISLSNKISDYVKNWNVNDKPKVCQIKEKFGGLRFYLSSGDNHIFTLVKEAEHESFKTCETCGNKEDIQTYQRGKRKFGWIKTLCRKCGTEWEKPY